MLVKLLTEHYLEIQSLKGGCRGSSESTHVKVSNCWKSHATAHLILSVVVIIVSRHELYKSVFREKSYKK